MLRTIGRVMLLIGAMGALPSLAWAATSADPDCCCPLCCPGK
jgi:hypothetical protein